MTKSHPGALQQHKPKMWFPSYIQNQGIEKRFLILVALSLALQAVFQQLARRSF